jgi:O-antigen/teichoic acid export membrane protein
MKVADAGFVASLALRMLGVSGKFVAVLVLARLGGARDVGEFGLFFAAINVLLFAIGFDFHLFTVRELLAQREPGARLRVILGQVALDSGIYALVLCAGWSLSILYGERLASVPILWFVVILVLDHCTQELSRLFTVLRRPEAANVIYALKTGMWAWFAAAAVYLQALPARASSFYGFWIGGDLIALAAGLMLAARIFSGQRASLPAGLRAWIARGLGISWRFYASSVAIMCLAYIDRFVVARQISLAEAGRYAFWQSVVSLVPVVVYALAGMHFLPRLIEAYKHEQRAQFAAYRRQFMQRTVSASLLAAAALLLISPWVSTLLGKPAFGMSPLLVGALLLGACLSALWQVPYQVLYSASDDRFLALAVPTATAFATLLSFTLIAAAGIAGAVLANATSNAVMYLLLDRRSRRHFSSGPALRHSGPL